MTVDPSPPKYPSELDIRHLATCDALGLMCAMLELPEWDKGEPSTRAVIAMVGNPHLTFEQCTHVLKHALNRWLLGRDIGVLGLSGAAFQIPANAPGDRAAEWWLRLALQPDLVSAPEESTLGDDHRIWLLRRAFATNGPEHWPALWRCWMRLEPFRGRDELLVFAARHGLPDERMAVMDLSERDIRELTEAHRAYGDARFRGLPRATSRKAAQQELATALAPLGVTRAAMAAPLRRTILDCAIAGELPTHYGPTDAMRWMALLDGADRAELLADPKACAGEPLEAWIGGRSWGHQVFDNYQLALRVFALDEESARSHLTCRAPRHRLALVFNPTCPEEIALEAIRRGVAETDVLLTSGELYESDGWGLVEAWWTALMGARGWLPADEVSAALRKVTGWMMSGTMRRLWFWRLAVTASRPDGVVGMSEEQYAAYESWLDRLVGKPWAPSERRFLTDHDDFGAATSRELLPRLVSATAGDTSPLLVQPFFISVLRDLPAELRVQATRRATAEVLQTLVSDPDKRVRQHVARARNASADTLARLAEDPEPTVRSQVARNPGVTAELLTLLAADSVDTVARAAGRGLVRKLSQAA